MENDLERFNCEVGEEAHYWWTVSDFVDLTLDYPLDKVLIDMLQLREQRKKAEENND